MKEMNNKDFNSLLNFILLLIIKMDKKYLFSWSHSKYLCHNDYLEIIEKNVENNNLVIYGYSWCQWTDKAKKILKHKYNADPVMILPDIVNNNFKYEMLKCIQYKINSNKSPQIWINQKHIGSFEDLINEHLN